MTYLQIQIKNMEVEKQIKNYKKVIKYIKKSSEKQIRNLESEILELKQALKKIKKNK